MERRIVLRSGVLVLLMALGLSRLATAQSDTTISIARKGIETHFKFLNMYIDQTPMWAAPSGEVQRMVNLIQNYALLEAECDSLYQISSPLDSLQLLKEETYRHALQTAEQRILNLTNTQSRLTEINAKLNDELIACEKLAAKFHRRSKRQLAVKTFLITLPIGVLLGIAL